MTAAAGTQWAKLNCSESFGRRPVHKKHPGRVPRGAHRRPFLQYLCEHPRGTLLPASATHAFAFLRRQRGQTGGRRLGSQAPTK